MLGARGDFGQELLPLHWFSAYFSFLLFFCSLPGSEGRGFARVSLMILNIQDYVGLREWQWTRMIPVSRIVYSVVLLFLHVHGWNTTPFNRIIFSLLYSYSCCPKANLWLLSFARLYFFPILSVSRPHSPGYGLYCIILDFCWSRIIQANYDSRIPVLLDIPPSWQTMWRISEAWEILSGSIVLWCGGQWTEGTINDAPKIYCSGNIKFVRNARCTPSG